VSRQLEKEPVSVSLASDEAASVSSFWDPRRKWFYLGGVVDLSFDQAHESRHGEVCRSPFQLLASLGLRKTLADTSSVYQAAHVLQCRPKLEAQLLTKIKTRQSLSGI
jgi:hypothetical protein